LVGGGQREPGAAAEYEREEPAYGGQREPKGDSGMEPAHEGAAEPDYRQAPGAWAEESYQAEPESGGGRKAVIALLIAAIVIVLLGGGGFLAWMLFLGPDKETGSQKSGEVRIEETLETREEPEETQETLAEEDMTEAEEQVVPEGMLSDSELAKTIARYNTGEDATVSIDVYQENYTPGARNTSLAWDKTLFYTLEDVNPDSAADGMINGYNISRKMLRNASTGNKMEYEIYANPATGKVNKIVSIEYYQNYLEITDYYYDDNGMVSFIFVRNDVNYIPSYAVPTKDGQRFYFNSDCMTKWRVVNGGVQTNYVIGSASAGEGYNPSGTVFQYSSLEAGAQTNYDLTEKRMINAAYNTYNIVLSAEGLSEITGYVYNEAGGPLPDASVILVSDDMNESLYEVKTDGEGKYRIVVPSENRSYRLVVANEGCVDTTVYGVGVSGQMLSDYQNVVYMVREASQPYDVNVQMYDALNYASDGNGMERLSNAAIYIRDGVNHRDGGVVAQGTADAQGQISMQLPPGMYTAEVVKQGYDSTFYNFASKEDMNTVQINASPKLAEGEVRIVLTWGERPWDLDSHLFTPYDNAFGDTTYHIWYGNKYDAVGNNLDVDDTDGYGPETMTIPVLKNGLYKYYVADFTNCSGGNPTSYDMSNSGAMVNVYTSNGLTSTFMVPTNASGVIWEVFEIRNGAIVPIQRYYSNIDDKSWWHNDK
ncbi:MAG: hypothetical protein LIP16_13320, partial [Clostridium sp.]|nr:hypothetical protein [Clostridium sp.]